MDSLGFSRKESSVPIPNLSHFVTQTINLAAICTPAEYNTHLLDTIYSNFFNAPPVVKYCSENNKRLIHFSTCEVLGRLLEAFSQRISLSER
ncbi:UDP-D-apiose/UDP-D-xylose synthase 2 [Ananas comosus]|uniref:UDP-D-apiose/UDP-D-xylose synthase 2 n=1 Tax=Ananas comosus TaxID=4615 RepID=A0A199VMS4_ANACO|nr:UDP-D-apiose/UDP-D-xylose synthase 2 [Ananas comosus]